MSQHNAPSVVYPLGRSRLQVQLLLGLWFICATVIGFWVANSATFGWRQGLGLATLAAAGATAWASWRNAPDGQLAWDNQDWRWESRGYQAGGVNFAVSVAFDFQSLMLLRIDNPDRAKTYLWAECSACPERWLDLRRAVYSPRRASGVDIMNSVSSA